MIWKNIDGFIEAANALGVKNFPSKEDIILQEKDLTTLVVEHFLTQKGIKPDFLPKENSEYTNNILTQFSQNPQDLKLKEKTLNQLEDIKSDCLDRQKSSVGSSLKNSIPQPNTEQKQYTENGFNITETTNDSKGQDGSRTVTKTLNFDKIGGNTKGSATASVTIGPNGEVKKELEKKTEATETVVSSGKAGNFSSTTTTKTTTSFSSFSSSSGGGVPNRS